MQKRLNTRKRRSRTLLLTALLAIGAALTIVYFNSAQLSQTLFLPGEPRTLSELDAYYPFVPDAENAALAFTRVAAAGFEGPAIDALYLPDDDPLADRFEHDPGAMTQVEAALLQKSSMLQALHSALQLPKSRFPVSVPALNWSVPPHLAELRSAARLLHLDTRYKVAACDTPGAVQSLIDLWQLGKLLENEPSVISQMTRSTLHGIAMEATANVLSLTSLSDQQLDGLKAVIDGESGGESFQRALVADKCLYLLERPFYAFPSDARFAALADRVIQATVLPRQQQIFELEAIDLEVDKDIVATSDFDPRMHFRVAPAMVVSGMRMTILSLEYDNARVELTLTAIAIERWRRAHGNALPTELRELVPGYLDAVPIDPLDGEPLRYRVTPKGYLLYSVGSDREDDKGLSSSDSTALDWVFEVRR